jgi:hypothetical protein
VPLGPRTLEERIRARGCQMADNSGKALAQLSQTYDISRHTVSDKLARRKEISSQASFLFGGY